jgi:hypothetical protein
VWERKQKKKDTKEKEMEEKNFIRMTDDGAKCIAVLG